MLRTEVFGTILAQIFYMFRPLVKINHTVLLFMFISSAIFWTDNHLSLFSHFFQIWVFLSLPVSLKIALILCSNNLSHIFLANKQTKHRANKTFTEVIELNPNNYFDTKLMNHIVMWFNMCNSPVLPVWSFNCQT